MKKLTIGLLAVLLVVMGLVFYKTELVKKMETVFPTFGWETMTLERCGVSFKYPREWKSNIKISGISMCTAYYGTFKPGVMDKVDFDGNSAEVSKIDEKGFKSLGTASEQIINGLPVTVIITKPLNLLQSAPVKSKMFIFKKGNFHFVINSHQNMKEDKGLLDIVDIIARTVRFTKNDSFYDNFIQDQSL